MLAESPPFCSAFPEIQEALGHVATPLRAIRAFATGSVGEFTEALKGPIVSIIILIPAKALSMSPCTRSTSAFRNFCS
jgi:hypothetical protein